MKYEPLKNHVFPIPDVKSVSKPKMRRKLGFSVFNRFGVTT